MKSRFTRRKSSTPPKTSPLAALYGEERPVLADEPSPEEIQPLVAELGTWMSEPVAVPVRNRLLSTVTAALPASTAAEPALDLVPLNGVAWVLRPGSKAPVPVGDAQPLSAGSSLHIPPRAAARVRFGDGSLLLLRHETEVQLYPHGCSGEQARLGRGQLYARIAPQSSGRFAISTPQAQISVLGTEFDLKVSGAGDEVALTVATGRVQYDSSAASSSSAAPRSITVTRGEGVSASAGRGCRKEVLSPAVLRQRTRWAEEYSSPQEGNGTIRRLLKAACVVGVLGIGTGAAWKWGWFPREAGKTDRAAAVALAIPDAQGRYDLRGSLKAGDERRVMIETERRNANGIWTPETTIEAKLEALKRDDRGRIQLQVTLLSKISREDGGRLEKSKGEENMATYWITPEGTVEEPVVPGQSRTDHAVQMRLAEVLEYDVHRIIPRQWMVPGEIRKSGTTVSLAHAGQTPITFADEIALLGVKEQGGRPIAQFSVDSRTEGRNLTLREDTRRNRVFRQKLGHFHVTRRGMLLYDTASGWPVEANWTSERVMSRVQEMILPGKSPQIRPIREGREEVKVRIRVEEF